MDPDPIEEEDDRPDASLLPRAHPSDPVQTSSPNMARLGMIRAYWLASVVCIGM